MLSHRRIHRPNCSTERLLFFAFDTGSRTRPAGLIMDVSMNFVTQLDRDRYPITGPTPSLSLSLHPAGNLVAWMTWGCGTVI